MYIKHKTKNLKLCMLSKTYFSSRIFKSMYYNKIQNAIVINDIKFLNWCYVNKIDIYNLISENVIKSYF